MKRIVLLFVLLASLFVSDLCAQNGLNDTESGILSYTRTLDLPFPEIVALKEAYLDTVSAPSSRFLKDFGRWEDFWENRVDEDEEFSTYFEVMGALSNVPNPSTGAQQPSQMPCCAEGGNWNLEGPFYDQSGIQRSGIFFSVYSHPDQFSDPDNAIVYAGSGAGGLWRTENGGDNWECLTDQFRIPGLGVPDIVGHPADQDQLLIATGFRRRLGDAYGFGIMKLETGSGQDVFSIPLSWDPVFGDAVYDLEIDPTNPNIVYAATSSGLYRSISTDLTYFTDWGEGWVQIFCNRFVCDISNDCTLAAACANPVDCDECPNVTIGSYTGDNPYDFVEVQVLPNGVVVAALESRVIGAIESAIIFSTDGGNTFELLPPPTVSNNWCQPNLGSTRAYLATANDTNGTHDNDLYVIYHAENNPATTTDCNATLMVYRHTFDLNNSSNNSWAFLANIDRGLSPNFPAFEVNQVNPDIVYLGHVEMHKYDISNPSGFGVISPTNSAGSPNLTGGTRVHSDTRVIQIIESTPAGQGDILLTGNDGGIVRTTSGGWDTYSGWVNMNGHDNISNTNSEMCVTEFFDMDVSHNTSRFILAGAQDNGTLSSDDPQNNYWGDVDGGDGGASLIDWSDPQAYFTRINPTLRYRQGGIVSFEQRILRRTPNNPCCNNCPPYLTNTGEIDRFYQGIFDGLELRQHPFESDSIYVAKGRLFYSFDINNNYINTPNPPDAIQGGLAHEFTFCEGPINTFEVSPSHPHIIYLAKHSPGERLYRSEDGGASWENIDDRIIRAGNIAELAFSTIHSPISIVIDPEDPNHIWCGLRDFFPGATGENTDIPCNNGSRRVVELILTDQDLNGDGIGNDYLETDISNGLPPLPVRELIREDMSGVMYCGTDVGVYRYDPNTYDPNTYHPVDNPEAGWQCFNTNLPPAIITDLEINHCDQRLYASTFGRGIFSSPLHENENAIIINTGENRVWSAGPAMYAHNDIIIRDGAKLTIKTTLYMSGDDEKGKAIIVEPGGILEVLGGTITAPCDQTWAGIYLGGDALSSQYPTSNQGAVFLNNARIENAHDAITTRQTVSDWLEYDSAGNIAGGTTGGIIKAHSTTFRNNKRAIEYLRYENIFNGTQINNVGKFSLCNFEIDEDYRFAYNQTSDSGLKPFVTMWGVNGIAFEGCTLEDKRMNIGSNFANGKRHSGKRGIQTIQAGYSVDWYCASPTVPLPPCTEGIPSRFVKLDYGIRSFGHDMGFNIIARNSEFDCWHGIYLNDTDAGMVQENDFIVKRAEAPKVPSYGLYLDYSRGYSAENNDFAVEQDPAIPASLAETTYAGVVVRNQHGNPEVIYRNTFSDFTVAVEAIGYNRQVGLPNVANGLEFRCNDFSSSKQDMFIVPDLNVSYIPPGAQPGIKPTQDLPGNLFSYSPLAAFAHISNDPSLNDVIYRHHDLSSNLRVVPTLLSGNVSLDGSNVPPFDSDVCPNLLESGGGHLNLSELEDIKEIKGNLYNQINTDLETAVDGGETEELKEDVEMASSQNAYAVYQDVIQKESFVSDTVLSEISKKETGFTTGMIRDMLASSPQAAKLEDIQQNLDERTVQLPQYMRDQINMGLTITSAKEQLELEAGRQKRERDAAIYQAVRLLASDSIDRTEEMIDFLSNTGDIGVEYRLAAVYDTQGETSLANTILEAIGQQELTPKEEDDHTDYMSFRGLIQNWKQAGKNLGALDETDLATLGAYLERQNITSGKAMTLLALNGQEYDEPVYVPSPPVEERKITEEDGQDNKINRHLLKVYPNPAQEYFIVEYAIAGNFENSYLVVTNVNGDVVHRQALNHEQDQLIIATQPFIAGQYFCTVEQQRQVLKSEKIVLIK